MGRLRLGAHGQAEARCASAGIWPYKEPPTMNITDDSKPSLPNGELYVYSAF